MMILIECDTFRRFYGGIAYNKNNKKYINIVNIDYIKQKYLSIELLRDI